MNQTPPLLILITFLWVAGGCSRPADPRGFSEREVRWRQTIFRVFLPHALSRTDSLRDAVIRASIPPNNDVIAAFYSEEQFRYAVIMGYRPNRDITARRQDFIRDREAIKAATADAAKLAKETVELVEKRLKHATVAGKKLVDVFLERPVLLGVYDESDRHVSSLMLIAVTTERDGAPQRSVVVCSSSLLFMKGKVITLSLYHPFQGRETYAKMKALTKTTVEHTLRMNAE